MTETVSHKPLHKTQISAQGCHLLDAFNPPSVTADSPATLVMTDLSKVPAATIGADAMLDDANRSMLVRGVRLLVVVDEHNKIAGLVSSVDVLGEKPLQVAQKHQCKRNELRVSDVMTAIEHVDALGMEDVKRASVGNIVSTLIADGRAHAIVVGDGHDGHQGRQSLMGIFSASQIARQLGVQIHTHEMARTFAEIEAVIAGI